MRVNYGWLGLSRQRRPQLRVSVHRFGMLLDLDTGECPPALRGISMRHLAAGRRKRPAQPARPRTEADGRGDRCAPVLRSPVRRFSGP